jgi:HAD superfamily hydrolase (TIGR01509 family)
VPFLGPPIEKTPRAVIFDIGRVIIGVDMTRSIGALGKHQGLSHLKVLRAMEADAHWPDWQQGRMAPRDWHAHLSKKLGFSYSFEEFCKIWNSVLHPDPILPETLFERLKKKCSLALLSNTDPIHVAHFEANYSFVRLFRTRVYSCRVGSSKPSPIIYHHALREVSAMPDEALFIDDLRENVMAAAGLGINAFHFTTPDELLHGFSLWGL